MFSDCRALAAAPEEVMIVTQPKGFFGTDVDLARMQQDRRNKLAAEMRARGVDLLLLVDPLNVEYATGVSQREGGLRSIALMTADQALHTFPAPPEPTAPLHPMMPEYMLDTWKDTALQIAEVLGHPATGRLALDRASLVSLRWLFQELGHPAKVQVTETGAAVVTAARTTKTVDEVECLRRSNRAMGHAMDAARAALQPGSTVADLIGPVREAFAQLDPTGDALTMAGGPASTNAIPGLMYIASASENFNAAGEPSFPFPPTPSRPFQEGDVVWPDCGLGYHGLESDYGRTWIVGGGSPSSHLRDQFRRWLEVRDRTVEALRPGRTCADAVGAAKAVGGKTPWLSHLFLAHGTGVFTEFPFFSIDPQGWLVRSLVAPAELRSFPRDEEVELKAGMVFVLEPVIWNEQGGYRAEDTYLVTDSEPELLSRWSYAPFD
jgi:Xaa-Pro dipeptidase